MKNIKEIFNVIKKLFSNASSYTCYTKTIVELCNEISDEDVKKNFDVFVKKNNYSKPEKEVIIKFLQELRKSSCSKQIKTLPEGEKWR